MDDRYERAIEAARNRINPGESVPDKVVELYGLNEPNTLKSAIKTADRAFKDVKQIKEDINNYKEFPRTIEGPDQWTDEMIEYWLNYEDPEGYLKGYESFKNANIGKPKDFEIKEAKTKSILGMPETVFETKSEWSEDDLKHYYVDLMRQLYDKDYWYENYRAKRFDEIAKKADDRVKEYLYIHGYDKDIDALRDKLNNAQSVQEQLDIIKADALAREKARIRKYITERHGHRK